MVFIYALFTALVGWLISLFAATMQYNPVLRTQEYEGFPPGTLAIVYLRYSTHDAQDIASQEAAVRKFAAERGWIMVEVYKDEALSGTSTTRRTDFARMMSDATKAPRIAQVLVLWDYSRFARNTTDATYYLAELRMKGWSVYSMNDTIPNDETAGIIEAVIHYKNARYASDAANSTRRGLHFLAERGYLPSSTPAKGYIVEKESFDPPLFRADGTERKGQRLYVDEEKREAIIKAFEMKASGATEGEIEDATNLFGPRFAKPKIKRTGFVKKDYYPTTKFFTNPAYIGKTTFGGVTYDNIYPRIISDELWNRVQEVITRNKLVIASRTEAGHPRRKASTFFLSGRMACARCGGLLVGSKGGRQTSYRNYYRCKTCKPNWQCRAEELEALVIESLLSHVLKPEVFQDLVEWTNQILQQDNTQLSLQLSEAQRSLKRLEATDDRVSRNYLTLENPTPSAKRILEETNKAFIEQKALVARLEHDMAKNKVRFSPKEVEDIARDRENRLRIARDCTEENLYLIKSLLDEVVTSITISPMECVIRVGIPDTWF